MLKYLELFALPALGVAVVAYLLGSISFSIILTRIFDNHKDIRSLGSGNAGMTNVLRSVGKLPALLTFILDYAKCAVAIIIGKAILQYFCNMYSIPAEFTQYGAYIAGFACIIGHIYPVYFNFRGGKGVVTCAAMMSLIDWRVFIICFSIFVLIFVLSKIISLSSIIAAAFYPIATFLITYFCDYKSIKSPYYGTISYVIVATAATFLIGLVIILKHKTNIIRLKNGTEKKIIGNKNK